MTIIVIVGVCIILAVLAFLLPRPSWWPQKGVDKTLGARSGRCREGYPARPASCAAEAVPSLAQGGQQERPEGPRGPRQDAGP